MGAIGYNGGSIIDQWASPVIYGNDYFLASDTGIVQGFNKNTGDREWTFNPVTYITSTFEDDEPDIYYDERYDRQYQEDKFYATPIIYKNNLIVASDDGYLISIKIP